MAFEAAVDTLAGTLGSCAGIIIGQPFDTVKVRVQAEAGRYSGPLDCAVKTVRHEGVRALFKGVVPPMVGNAPMGALLFVGYGSTTRYLEGRYGEVPEGTVDFGRVSLAAMAGGVMASVAATPVELVKCKLQVHSGYTGTWDCVRKTVEREGFFGLYRGHIVTAFRDVPAYAAYFLTYEALKLRLTPDGAKEAPVSAQLFAGGMAGVACWGSTFPFDVLKSRIQTVEDPAKRGMVVNARQLYREAGVAGFFRGIVPTVMRAFPTNAVTFFVYEAVVSALSRAP